MRELRVTRGTIAALQSELDTMIGSIIPLTPAGIRSAELRAEHAIRGILPGTSVRCEYCGATRAMAVRVFDADGVEITGLVEESEG